MRTIRDRILKNNPRTIKLLELYKDILQFKEIIADGKADKIELRLSGLVVKKQGKLKVYNPIYQQVFNNIWVEQEQNKLRPYADKLSAWLKSDRQDKLKLLAGEELQAVLEWSADKSLSVQDYQFLADSQQLEKEKVKKQARNTLNEARIRAKKLIRTSFVIMLTFFFVTAFVVFLESQSLTEAQQATKLEKAGLTALREFEDTQIESLFLAMQTGQDLKSLLGKNNDLEKYPTVTPLLALQTILDDIRLRQTNEFNPGQEGINSLTWFNNDTQIATAGEDGTVQLTNLNSQQANQKKKFQAHQKKIKVIDYLQRYNPTQLATGGEDGELKVWDIKSINADKPEPLYSISTKQGGINHVRFISKTKIVTSGEDGTLKLWSLPESQFKKNLITTIQAHNNCHIKENKIECDSYQPSIKSLNRSDDNNWFVTGGDDGLAKLWEIDENGIKYLATFTGHKARINSVNFSSKCKDATNECKVATGSADGTVKIWNPLVSDKELLEFTAHPEGVEVVRFSTKDANILATASKDGIIKLWKLKEHSSTKVKTEQFAEFKGHQGSIVSFRFTEDGKQLATAGKNDSVVRLWKVNKEETALKLLGHQKPIDSVRFNVERPEIVTASDDGTVRLWDISTIPLIKPKLLENHPNNNIKIKSVRFSPDAQRIATAGSEGVIRLWLRQGDKWIEEKCFPANQGGTIWSMDFSPQKDKDILATAGNDGTVKLWNFKGERLDTSPAFTKPLINNSKVESVRFNHQGDILAIVGENSKAGLWKIGENNLRELMKNHQGTVYGVGFSRDDQQVVTAGNDGTIQRWDLSGNPHGEILKTYQGTIRNISFSEDGKFLATAGYVGTVRLWTSSGQLLADFKGHEGTVRSLNFSKDKKHLVTAGDDGTAIVWNIKGLDELINDGCNWLKDYLSTHLQKKQELQVCQSMMATTNENKN